MAARQANIADGQGHKMVVDQVKSSPKKVLLVVASPTVSTNNGWPVGFWASELTHPYYELTERGLAVTIASPDGGKVEFEKLSDPRDESKWSAEDLITMGFIHTPELMALLEDTPKLSSLDYDDYDALLISCGQSLCAPSLTTATCRVQYERSTKQGELPAHFATGSPHCSMSSCPMARTWYPVKRLPDSPTSKRTSATRRREWRLCHGDSRTTCVRAGLTMSNLDYLSHSLYATVA
jgi:hypothetical protein